jgi:hypothetical protein
MQIRIPSEADLRSLGRNAFESERALQRFLEGSVCPVLGLHVVASSQAAGGRLGGGIDTSAIRSAGLSRDSRLQEEPPNAGDQVRSEVRWRLTSFGRCIAHLECSFL